MVGNNINHSSNYLRCQLHYDLNFCNPLPITMTATAKIQTKNLETSPDKMSESEKEKIEMVSLGDLTVARVTLQPG